MQSWENVLLQLPFNARYIVILYILAIMYLRGKVYYIFLHSVRHIWRWAVSVYNTPHYVYVYALPV